MGFFKRLFSADYRAAVAAEAAGDLELAAERYALSGERDAAVRVHLERANRADTRAAEIAALRDAAHWAPTEGDYRRTAFKRLGHALLARAKAEGIGTDRDRERIREACGILEQAREFRAAGEAYESIGEDALAARAFRRGGLVDRLEAVLAREDQKSSSERTEREAYADYQVAERGGDRDRAIALLRRCLEAAEDKSQYRGLLDELESRLLSGGRVTLKERRGDQVILFCGERLLIGRDPLCDLPLRSTGLSRRHAEITLGSAKEEFPCTLRDVGSKNGTHLGGLRISGEIPLDERGSFRLGTDCDVDFDKSGSRLELRIDSGLDQGTVVVAVPPEQAIDLTPYDVPVTVQFRRDRPFLRNPIGELRLNGQRIAHGEIQLVRGDQLSVEGIELDVL